VLSFFSRRFFLSEVLSGFLNQNENCGEKCSSINSSLYFEKQKKRDVIAMQKLKKMEKKEKFGMSGKEMSQRSCS
jgi:hypothetical protein